MNDLLKPEFKNFNVLVIGDICEDIFTYGDAFRLAPEAPIPVFTPSYTKSNPGMAGNVVANLEALGVNVIPIHNTESVSKNRFVDDRSGQILLRVDKNDKVKRIKFGILKNIKNNLYLGNKIDAIIVSDYNKGFLLEEDIEFICKNNSNVFIDTKKVINGWIKYASFIKINHIEFERTKYTLKNLDISNKLIITKSSDGCEYKGKTYPVKKVQIKDVSGAGDTFISGLVTEYIRTKNIKKAIIFAQKCASIVVQKIGVSTI